MKPITLSQFQEIDGGPLVELMFERGVWRFTFSNTVAVEIHSGWRLFAPAEKRKTLVGSRDLENADDPLASIQEHLEGYSLGALHFNLSRDCLDLGLFDADLNHMKVEIQKTSVHKVNWRIIGEDFEDDDRKNIIQNL